MKLYTTEEVADILKMDTETTRRFIREGKITAYKVGSEWRVKEEDLVEFVERNINTKGD